MIIKIYNARFSDSMNPSQSPFKTNHRPIIGQSQVEKMIKPLPFFFSVFITIHILSCNGSIVNQRNQASSNKTNNKSVALGKKVTEIDDQIWVVYQDKMGKYWFGSNGKGVYHLDGEVLTLYTTDDGLVHDQIRGIQEDSLGNIYIETHGGISKFDGTKFVTLEVMKSHDNQWQLDPTDLWFGYNANDVYRYDGTTLIELALPRQDIYTAFGIRNRGLPTHLSPYDVFGVNKDKDGNLWFGTATAGAYRYDGDSFIWFGEKELSTLPDGRVPGVRSMVQDRDGYFWLSNFYSKYEIDPDIEMGYKKHKAVDLPKEVVQDKLLYFMSGVSDREGNLWMITYSGGVWKYDGKSLSNFEIHNDTEEILLICIYQDNKGVIWLGTKNDGVYRRKGDSFEKFSINTLPMSQ